MAQLPTALEPTTRLTKHLGGPQYWIEREDTVGIGFGGNKLHISYPTHS